MFFSLRRIAPFSIVAVTTVCSLDTVGSALMVPDDLTVSPVLLKVIEEVEVPALQEGPIHEILVREGQVVGVGEPLMQIDDQRARFRKNQAEIEHSIAIKKASNKSEVKLAEVESRVAAASLQRAMDSRKRFPDTPSQAEVDEIELRFANATQNLEEASNNFQLAELARELAEKNVAIASFEVERHKIKAPIQGAVIEMIARRGEWVRPGEPLLRLMRIDRLRVEGFLKRDLVRAGLEGSPVTIILEGTEGDKGRFPGKIVFVSLEVDPGDKTQRVIAEVDNSKQLLAPGLRAKMIIHAR
jgi:macrolide-specific efflux system membrane fusion protein